MRWHCCRRWRSFCACVSCWSTTAMPLSTLVFSCCWAGLVSGLLLGLLSGLLQGLLCGLLLLAASAATVAVVLAAIAAAAVAVVAPTVAAVVALVFLVFSEFGAFAWHTSLCSLWITTFLRQLCHFRTHTNETERCRARGEKETDTARDVGTSETPLPRASNFSSQWKWLLSLL